jgi:hypothetical protein
MSENQVKQLIETNKDKRLFLGFWSGMLNDEFNRVKEYENKIGNLRNDKFIIQLPIEFEVINDYNSKKIKLSYINIDNSPYYECKEKAINSYEKKGLNEIIGTLDKKYRRFDREYYKSSQKAKMDFPVEEEKNYSDNQYEPLVIKISKHPFINIKDRIIWKDNNRVIDLEYTINGDFKKSIEFNLSISYALFNDFLLEVESELTKEKKDIERRIKEREHIEMEFNKSKNQL